MKNLAIILLVFLFSCSSYRLSERENKDYKLTAKNMSILDGFYSNSSIDSASNRLKLINQFQKDTSLNSQINRVRLNPINENRLEIQLFKSDTLLKTISLKGKYKKGYFRVKRKWLANLIVGPLVWILAEESKYIGLTKSNQVIVLKATQGALLIVAFPLGGANDDSFFLYKKVE